MQCFDLNTWFDCHDKARSFSCPLCSKSLTVDELVIDKFVQSILKQTKQNIVSVLLSPNGNWTAVVPADEGNSAKRKNALGEN